MKVVETTLENKRIIEDQKSKLEQEVASRTIELQKTNRQLTETNEKLMDLNREKDGLINIVAHDLKSPLCSIIGFTELIKREGELNHKQDEYLSIINSVSQNGLYLIDDLLDVHSYEFGYSKVNHQKIHISQFINDWLKTFHQQIENKEQKVHFEDNMTNSSYSTDPFMLSRILNNILSNAIKFSNKGKTIYVKTHDTPTSIHISIRDEGPGISQDDQKLMFKRFQKLSARPTDGESSNGLGLSIVQALVEKLNGEISVKTQLGEGTEFNISLPVNQQPENIKKES
ncbi:HAMP domain-containing histidine kinase [Carboxylicivirga mesophila]|uniref:histidine kinase n=1 Tax=Carboxylicivirga mesophila TaxID=1166478 RepID=A0ABS5K6G8_9BACT|nr:HAMP domain-containing sensor histidine kinase [Carboxylicivirga mesophila]MBS2210106.1 HAMP domain-containing histidine kinase [Carboxylicivirga mesophila]